MSLVSSHPAMGRVIEAAGIRTNYHEMGEGTPVVLLHGSGAGVSAWENWHTVMPALSRQFRVIAPDIVGFGYTERPDNVKYTIKLWVQHLLGFLDALQIERAVMVGNSFGGALALATAIRNAHRVEKMVLMGTPAGEFEREITSSAWSYEPSLENMGKLLRRFPHDESIVTDEMIRLRHETTERAGGMEAYRRLFPEPGQPGEKKTVRGLPERDLRSISTPMLALHGREDGMVPFECGLRIAQWCPNADLHLFANCGHWVQLERSGEFTELASRFIQGPH